MSIKSIILKQYQSIVDRTAKTVQGVNMPKEGWIRTTRKSLKMSGAQLARRMGVSRSNISNVEKAELSGGVSLKNMVQIAEAMNCRFVYAIVPEDSAQSLIEQRAMEKSRRVAQEVARQMAMEAQTLSDEQLKLEVERLTRNYLAHTPTDFWDD